jgi:hypothetical protein
MNCTNENQKAKGKGQKSKIKNEGEIVTLCPLIFAF